MSLVDPCTQSSIITYFSHHMVWYIGMWFWLLPWMGEAGPWASYHVALRFASSYLHRFILVNPNRIATARQRREPRSSPLLTRRANTRADCYQPRECRNGPRLTRECRNGQRGSAALHRVACVPRVLECPALGAQQSNKCPALGTQQSNHQRSSTSRARRVQILSRGDGLAELSLACTGQCRASTALKVSP